MRIIKDRFTDMLIISSVMTAFLVLPSCGVEETTGPQGHQVSEIVILPDSVSMTPGEEQQFTVHALTAEGDTVDQTDLDIEWNWISTDAEVFTVEPGGLATGRNPGQAFCVVEATVIEAGLNFTGRDSAFVMVF